MSALPNGHVLNGTYELKSTLGKGGFGITYHGFDRHLQTEVAIKELFPSDFASRLPDNSVAANAKNKSSFEWGLKSFMDEARIIAKLKHPNIIQVRTYFEENGTAYMVMPFARGTSLEDAISQRFWSEDEIAKLLLPILDGLKHVHESGLIHRDIKPANILLLEDGTPVLLDFGSARRSSSESKTSVMTDGFAPPEQYDDQGDQGSWTDIYSLGGVVYQMVTGNSPQQSAPMRVMNDRLQSAVESASDRYNVDFLKIIDDAMRLDVKERLRDADQWSARLQPVFKRTKHLYTQKLLQSLFSNKTHSKYVKLGKLLESYGYKNRTVSAIDNITSHLRTVGLWSNLSVDFPVKRDENVSIKPVKSGLDTPPAVEVETVSPLSAEIQATLSHAYELITSFFKSIGTEDHRTCLDEDESAWVLTKGSAVGHIGIIHLDDELLFNIEAQLMELPSDSVKQAALLKELLERNLQLPFQIRFGVRNGFAITSANIGVADLEQDDFDSLVFAVMSISDDLDDDLIARYG